MFGARRRRHRGSTAVESATNKSDEEIFWKKVKTLGTDEENWTPLMSLITFLLQDLG